MDLWLIGVPATDELPPAAEGWLSAEERWRVEGQLRAGARQERRIAYAARRAVLSFYGPCHPGQWRFSEDARGRPQLVSPPGVPGMGVSLSHAGGLVAIAVTQIGDVGVDIARVDARRRIMLIAERCFAAEEVAALRAAPAGARPDLFARLWALKESYLKARGVGVWGGVALDGCRFGLGEDGRVRFDPAPGVDERPHEWWFFTLAPTAGHRASVAVRGGANPRLAVFALASTLDAFTVMAAGPLPPLSPTGAGPD